jgi:hypothetical protein
MFGIGALLIIGVYIALALGLSAIFPTRARMFVLVAAVGLPVSFPYWHHLYPSYSEFQSLCNSGDRSVIKKIQPVKFIYEDSCESAYSAIKGKTYKGYECSAYRPEYATWELGVKHYFQFTPNGNWGTQACQSECVDKGYSISWEQNCQAQCFDAIEIAEPSFKFKFLNTDSTLIDGRLYRTRISVEDGSGEEMSVLMKYVYYPYGNGFAQILGMASGSAPSLSCKEENGIYRFNFLKPASDGKTAVVTKGSLDGVMK